MSEHVRETYHAAIQHDLVDLPSNVHLAGVVRKPTGWFRAGVDENYPELGPPESLLEETKSIQSDFESRGLCTEGAHNAAWEEADFDRRYRAYVDGSTRVKTTLQDLAEMAREGTTVVLVCFEAPAKRCHRHVLLERLRDRLNE